MSGRLDFFGTATAGLGPETGGANWAPDGGGAYGCPAGYCCPVMGAVASWPLMGAG